MLRSLSSGVAGMKTHQTRLDVIGNNISNVNTYGFKSSRTTFSSVFYQTTSAAKSSTADGGGVNSKQVGYGAQVGGIDVLMTRSGFTATGVTTDLAIAGEGFFQVMDGAGNIYYTRNGAFQFDSAGYLVDTNGNYVLGINGDALGQEAGSYPIRVNLGSVDAAYSSVSNSINGKEFSITSENKTTDANVTFTFVEGAASAFDDPNDTMNVVVTNGKINVTVNPNATFASLEKFNETLNSKISEYLGYDHPAGNFTIIMPQATGSFTGREICSTDYSTQYGSVETPSFFNNLGIKFEKVGPEFSADVAKLNGTSNNQGTASFKYDKDNNEITLTYKVDNNTTYSCVISEGSTAPSYKMKRETGGSPMTYDEEDYIVVKVPSYENLCKVLENQSGTTTTGNVISKEAKENLTSDITPSKESRNLGLSTSSWQLTGGTDGGAQSLSDLTNIAISGDGTVTATHAVFGTVNIGKVCLATFENPSGLDQASTTYFTLSANSGDPVVTYAGQGGSGTLQSGALEMSNVDLSTEMSDMIVTERGFQAASRIITVSDEVLQELINLKR